MVFAVTGVTTISEPRAPVEPIEGLTISFYLVFLLPRLTRLFFPLPILLFCLTVRRPHFEVRAIIGGHILICRHPSTLSSSPPRRPESRLVWRATAEKPKLPCALAKISDFLDRDGAAFCMRSAGTHASVKAPPICILDSAVQRSKSDSTKYTSIVWSGRLNCKKWATPPYSELAASGAS